MLFLSMVLLAGGALFVLLVLFATAGGGAASVWLGLLTLLLEFIGGSS